MRRRLLAFVTGVFWLGSLVLANNSAYAQTDVPTSAQLDELLAPIALYPDALVAQICAAATDPQQVLDVDNWVQQNAGLSAQARTDAAQQRGFDPAFIALVNFPQVLDVMAQNIDSYAAIGRAFSADQATVMDSIQRLRQQAYAAGALQSNEYQNVEVQDQGGVQAVTIAPANPQVIYIPQYNPTVIYQPPDAGTVIAASLVSFGAGIVLGAWITDNRYPWGWGGWGWNWGRRTLIVHNNVWIVNNRYRPTRPYYHYRPPAYNRPIYVRPPSNWHDRPYYRPPPGGSRPPGGRPPGGETPGGGRPPPGNGNPGGRPPGGGNGRPPGNGGYQPPGTLPPQPSRPQVRPTRPTPMPRPSPGGNTGSAPPGTVAPPRPAALPGVGTTRPVAPPTSRPTPQQRPSPYAGYPRPNTGAPSNTGARPSAFGGSHNPSADRAASSRGRSSTAAAQRDRQRNEGQRR